MEEIKVFSNCEKCGFSTNWDFSLASHVKTSHRTVREKAFDCGLAFIEKFLCPDGDCRTHMKVNFDIHMRRGHDWDNPEFIHEVQEEFHSDLWECPECDFKTFSHLPALAHNFKQECLSESKIKDVKGEISLEPCKNKWVYCDHCSCSYKTHIKGSLKAHVNADGKVKWFQCDQCTYKTKDKTSLKRHVVSRHVRDEDVKWFNCEHCDYKAKRHETLKNHIKAKHSSHYDFAVLNCAHCNYTTLRKNNLKKHLNIKHTSDDKVKWFQCDQCNYKSKRRTCLTTHVINHHVRPEDVKWFQCDECSYKTKWQPNLHWHKKSRHGLKEDLERFKCNQCSYKTKYKAHLTRHVSCQH